MRHSAPVFFSPLQLFFTAPGETFDLILPITRPAVTQSKQKEELWPVYAVDSRPRGALSRLPSAPGGSCRRESPSRAPNCDPSLRTKAIPIFSVLRRRRGAVDGLGDEHMTRPRFSFCLREGRRKRFAQLLRVFLSFVEGGVVFNHGRL
ncbi:hypothetical protein L596_011714 [Steinernema carpocapsae]|uniref:Uncharacterized protein n=1 Tax=Steinernema carpocapsae TaxID=34508 RepID=A0A4U5NUU3_STECR|nr:hypothetical protein L596_011714 [Steinernema carpocapsae]